MLQEYGSKADCIKILLETGYKKAHIVMIGDVPGDIFAAKKCGVFYYPIIPGKEDMDWKRWENQVLPLFLQENYLEEEMKKYEAEFFEILK